ncbi:MAG: diguanylate cyclase [Phycisphaerae bacterium]|nr:diguanylate cyclase [Phycisphaerae bacterium]
MSLSSLNIEDAVILVVDDDACSREVIRRRLEQRGFEVHTAVSGEDALDLITRCHVDLVLLDVLMPGLDGLEVLAQIREKHTSTNLPVIMLTMKEDSDCVVRALNLGANDFVGKSVDGAVLLARIKTHLMLSRSVRQIHQLAMRDPLTGLYNRRGFFELADKEIERARRYSGQLQAMMLDIDHFKKINDTFGHRIGDQVLAEVADRCRNQLRSIDLIGRYGGEEFVVLVEGVDFDGALNTAERLGAAIASTPFQTLAGPLTLTISAGLASFDPASDDLADLLGKADQALYQAKRTGRNRVCA